MTEPDTFLRMCPCGTVFVTTAEGAFDWDKRVTAAIVGARRCKWPPGVQRLAQQVLPL
jgi:hypothetical protein